MLRFFYSEIKPVPRFKQKIESQKILELLTKLKIKEQELKKSSDKLGSSSPDYAKYLVIKHLVNNLNKAIVTFNAKPLLEDDLKESLELLTLLRELAAHLKMVQDNHRHIINTYRTNTNQKIKGIVDVTAISVLIASGVYLPIMLTCGSLVLTSIIHPNIKDNIVDDIDTATTKLIKEFIKILASAIQNLVLAINLKQLEGNPVYISSEDNMLCLITHELMEEPVTCLLDGYSYEKADIIRWLTEHRNSPMTRKEMPADAQVENMIIENRTLKNIIQDYKYYLQAFRNNAEEGKVAEMKH